MDYNFYVAGPFFNEKERSAVDAVVNLLRNKGFKVYSPKEHKISDGETMPNMLWARAVYNEDVQAIDDSYAVIILNWGLYSDSGTAWEAGYAMAKGKKTLTLLCGDITTTPYSLMCVNGADGFNTLDGFLNHKKDYFQFEKLNQK